ncbi:MAG: hypothetical protein ABF812_16450, partial [Gluconobacter cerinus]|uniref:hypothetical protein n=1 Tax=Gluconobacter cerinus TaxID=38307 RepID=UPI0039EA956F
ILSKLTSERRQEFSHLELGAIYLSDESPLLFSELKNTICGLWDFFQNSIEMQKNEFEYHMNTINKFRIDAHSKGISSDDFNKTRVSLTSIENCLPPQF